jgi:hypothetical protein
MAMMTKTSGGLSDVKENNTIYSSYLKQASYMFYELLVNNKKSFSTHGLSDVKENNTEA